jgi:hypothetical protein
MESCDVCREALARVRRLDDLASGSPAPPVPDGFAARVVTQAAERQAVVTPASRTPRRALRSTRKSFQSSVGTVAALVAGLVMGLFMGHGTWWSGRRQPPVTATRPTDALSASGIEHLVEPGGDSLAQAYCRLTAAPIVEGLR